MNGTIARALEDGRPALEARRIVLVVRLEATVEVLHRGEPLEAALYTIFRALPHRLAPGSVLFVRTRDRAGGDVEVTWESQEEPRDTCPEGEADGARDLLRRGPHGDLLDLAVLTLEEACRARAGFFEVAEGEDARSPVILEGARVRRRVSALLPGIRVAPG